MDASGLELDHVVLHSILCNLHDARHLAAAACVSRDWRAAANDSDLWRRLATRQARRPSHVRQDLLPEFASGWRGLGAWFTQFRRPMGTYLVLENSPAGCTADEEAKLSVVPLTLTSSGVKADSLHMMIATASEYGSLVQQATAGPFGGLLAYTRVSLDAEDNAAASAQTDGRADCVGARHRRRRRQQVVEVVIATVQGEELGSVALRDKFAPFYFYWSPCGTRLAFLSNWENATVALRLLDVGPLLVRHWLERYPSHRAGQMETAAIHEVFLHKARPLFMTWNPDGTRLLIKGDSRQYAIMKVPPAGTGYFPQGLLTHVQDNETAEQGQAPQWLLDSKGASLLLLPAELPASVVGSRRRGHQLGLVLYPDADAAEHGTRETLQTQYRHAANVSPASSDAAEASSSSQRSAVRTVARQKVTCWLEADPSRMSSVAATLTSSTLCEYQANSQGTLVAWVQQGNLLVKRLLWDGSGVKQGSVSCQLHVPEWDSTPLRIWPCQGGEPAAIAPLTDMEQVADVLLLQWSPDGRKLLFLVAFTPQTQEETMVMQRMLLDGAFQASDMPAAGPAPPLLPHDTLQTLRWYVWEATPAYLQLPRHDSLGAGGAEAPPVASAADAGPEGEYGLLHACWPLQGLSNSFRRLYLPFFSQYSQSVRLWSPDSSCFVYTAWQACQGYITRGATEAEERAPRPEQPLWINADYVYVQPLQWHWNVITATHATAGTRACPNHAQGALQEGWAEGAGTAGAKQTPGSSSSAVPGLTPLPIWQFFMDTVLLGDDDPAAAEASQRKALHGLVRAHAKAAGIAGACDEAVGDEAGGSDAEQQQATWLRHVADHVFADVVDLVVMLRRHALIAAADVMHPAGPVARQAHGLRVSAPKPVRLMRGATAFFAPGPGC